MSRHLILALAIIFCNGTVAFSETPDRYTTIATVIRVAEDIDEYLDTDVEVYPEFQDESFPYAEVDFSPNEATRAFELSSSNWFANYDAAGRDTLTPMLGESSLSQLKSEIDLHEDELIAAPTTMALRDSVKNQESALDSQLLVDGHLWAEPFQGVRETPTLSAPPVLAATMPRTATSRAQSAGLWIFLGLMTAPFAWLGWTEYKDLKNRSHRTELSEAELTTLASTSASEPCETKRRFMESEETVTFTEVSSDDTEFAEDDCDLELGVLEDANTLLASVGSFKQDFRTEEQTLGTTARNQNRNDDANDLTTLRGVGPATRDYLVSKGIVDVNDLLEADTDRIQEILDEAGTRFSAAQPAKWVEQARNQMVASH